MISTFSLHSLHPLSHSFRSIPRSFPSFPVLRHSFSPIAPSLPPSQLSITSKRGRKFDRKTHCSMADAVAAKGTEKVEIFESEEELCNRLAVYVAELSEKFSKERGAFTVVLSGGSLVKSLRKLLEDPYVSAVEWVKWHVFWVDERVVPKDHPDSNYKLAYDSFLSKVPIPSGNVYAINDSLSADAAADDYETCMKQLVKSGVIDHSAETGLPKFDLILLGMGPDGHVASLFPGHPLLKESDKWVTFLKDSPKPPPERITFTFPVINSAVAIGLVVTGSGKAEAVRKALKDESQTDMLPVEMVHAENGQLTWFTDKGATSLL